MYKELKKSEAGVSFWTRGTKVNVGLALFVVSILTLGYVGGSGYLGYNDSDGSYAWTSTDKTMIECSNGNRYNATVTNIQIAINSVGASGKISVPKGNYYTSSGIDLHNNTEVTFEPGVFIELTDNPIRIGSNCTLILYGAKIKLRSSNGATTSVRGIQVYPVCKNSFIMGGEMNGNYSTITDTATARTEGIRTTSSSAETDWAINLHIYDMYIHDCTHSLVVPGGENIIIGGCRFSNSTNDHAVYSSMSSNNFGFHVSNCEFFGFFDRSVVQFGGNGNTLEQCTFHNFVVNPDVSNSYSCIHWVHVKLGSSGTVISNNVITVTKNLSIGINMEGNRIIFSGNVINATNTNYSAEALIRITTGSSNVSISHNTVYGWGDGLLYQMVLSVSAAKNITISDNIFTSKKALSRGMQLGSTITKIMITGNVIQSAGYAFRTSGTGVTNMIVTGNTITGDWVGSTGLSNSIIKDNIITGTQPNYQTCTNVINKDNIGLNYNYFYPFYNQSTAPTMLDDTWAYWYDNDENFFYMVCRVNNTVFYYNTTKTI